MRNFYMKAKVDGRQTPIIGGPRVKDGSMFISLYQKEREESVEVIKIVSSVLPNGKLRTAVYVRGAEPKIIVTEP